MISLTSYRQQALSVCCSRLILEPLKQIASAGGECFRLFFKEVPLQWQPFVFVALLVIIVLIIITHAGFEIWTPLLRLVVRTPNPAPVEGNNQNRLQEENERLTREIQRLREGNVPSIQQLGDDAQTIENVGVQGSRDLRREGSLEQQLVRLQRQASPVNSGIDRTPRKSPISKSPRSHRGRANQTPSPQVSPRRYPQENVDYTQESSDVELEVENDNNEYLLVDDTGENAI